MKQIINGHDVEIYDSIENAPIRRFFSFTRYVIIDSGIGSDPSSINNHFSHLSRLIRKGQKDDALMELFNTSEAFRFMMEGFNLKGKAVYCMVKSIDGKVYPNHLSDSDIEEIEKRLESFHISYAWVLDKFETLKKKIDSDFEVYFPGGSVGQRVQKRVDQKRKLNFVLDSVINEAPEEEYTDGIIEISDDLFSGYKPNVMGGENGKEAAFVRSCEEAMASLSKYMGMDMNNSTTLQFYQAKELAEKLNKNK
jgi:hypothetical protein